MKKIVSILVMTLLLSACTGQPAQTTQSKPNTSSSTTQTEPSVGKKIMPLPATLDIDALSDATVATSFAAKDLTTDAAGNHSLFLTVYDYELFDLVDISTMAVNDTIVVGQKEVKIDTLEKTDGGLIIVNGGIENDGVNFFTDDNTVYYQSGMDVSRFFFEVGQAQFTISENFQLIDNSDLDSPNQTFDYDAFEKKVQNGEIMCDQFNTTAVINGGEIVEITLSFVP